MNYSVHANFSLFKKLEVILVKLCSIFPVFSSLSCKPFVYQGSILVRVIGHLDLSGQRVPEPCSGRCSLLAGGLIPTRGGRLAAKLLPRQESRRSQRFIFILAPAVMSQPALHLVSPGRESNLVSFSILEAL